MDQETEQFLNIYYSLDSEKKMNKKNFLKLLKSRQDLIKIIKNITNHTHHNYLLLRQYLEEIDEKIINSYYLAVCQEEAERQKCILDIHKSMHKINYVIDNIDKNNNICECDIKLLEDEFRECNNSKIIDSLDKEEMKKSLFNLKIKVQKLELQNIISIKDIDRRIDYIDDSILLIETYMNILKWHNYLIFLEAILKSNSINEKNIDSMILNYHFYKFWIDNLYRIDIYCKKEADNLTLNLETFNKIIDSANKFNLLALDLIKSGLTLDKQFIEKTNSDSSHYKESLKTLYILCILGQIKNDKKFLSKNITLLNSSDYQSNVSLYKEFIKKI